jgi:hypothetical protein
MLLGIYTSIKVYRSFDRPGKDFSVKLLDIDLPVLYSKRAEAVMGTPGSVHSKEHAPSSG